MSLLKFLQYHNAVPIVISIVLLGAGGAFAATDPQAIYSQDQQVISIDNTYLVNKDLSTYTPTVQITSVTEDDQNYYVAYNFSTIDLENSVWQDVVKPETLTVSKADLGPYRDLGVYVTQQLQQNIDNELTRLKETQAIERQNVSQKTVATIYGGLVGKMLNDTTETLPGYTPVVQGPPDTSSQTAAGGAGSGSSSSGGSSVSSQGNPSLQLTVLGNDPAQVPVGASYADLGAIATDAKNDNIRIGTSLDGVPVSSVQINTSATSTHTITYVATDPAGNSISSQRTVIVYDPASGPPVPASQVAQNASVGGLPAGQPASSGNTQAPSTPVTSSQNTNTQATTTQTTNTSTTTTGTTATTTDTQSASSTPASDNTSVDSDASTTPDDSVATSSASTDSSASSTSQTSDDSGTATSTGQ